MSQPKRVQLSRRKGYRKPEGAVVVARPSKWGNPFPVQKDTGRAWAKSLFHMSLIVRREVGPDGVPDFAQAINGYPSEAEVRAELSGKDLACWCPLDQPCHADVLLDLANRSDKENAA